MTAVYLALAFFLAAFLFVAVMAVKIAQTK